ncbi:MAG: type ISP restriction/modification enzyme, partial [Helicobacter sp.]|nr:type ISP restriction/modification enzyme [Helicobacter sp.]
DKILKLLEDYKQSLNEQNIQPLNDDYIKFIRFAQWKLLENNKNPNNSKYGVMGFITNNSFIYGRTHRKMRESLFKGFDEIYILNLHGDSKRDLNDKNVFDIQQGVCISIFVKYQDSTSSCSVKYYSTYDNDIRTRGDKFALLSSIAYKGLESIKWLSLEPSEPYYWFINREVDESYEDFWALAKDESLGETKAIFNTHSSCITSSNDKIAIQFDKDSLKLIANDFYKLDSKEIAEKYKIKNKVDWDIQKVKNDITQALKAQENKNIDKLIKPIAYRPFDTRFTLYAGRQGFLGRPRASVMNQLAWQENIALCFPKTTLNNTFDYGFVVKNIADRALNGKNTASETYIAPLYTYNNMMQNAEKSPNFTDEFNEFIKRHKILKTKTPEEILAYIYATLHNPNYRKKYKENLKIGFPRIDFKAKKEKFEKFITLGQKLIKLHLLKNISQDSSIEVNFSKDANKQNYSKIIKKLKFSDRFKDSKLIINDDLEINGVGNEMANFSIGGYLVLDKYLSYRVGMEADLENLLDICNAIKETLEIYKELREIK